MGVCAAGFAAGQSPTTELTGFNYYFLMHFLCWLLVIANAALVSGTNTNNGGQELITNCDKLVQNIHFLLTSLPQLAQVFPSQNIN